MQRFDREDKDEKLKEHIKDIFYKNKERFKVRMLDQAFNKYPNLEGLIMHSDMGWQYQHQTYQNRLREKGIIQSMSRKGNYIDNCIMESFFGTLKNEMFYCHE